jgi:hypothetical protein
MLNVENQPSWTEMVEADAILFYGGRIEARSTGKKAKGGT